MPVEGEPPMPYPWVCFHCGEEFWTAETAAEHFGTSEMDEPHCRISAREVREMERELRLYRAEDGPKDRALMEQAAETAGKVRAAEEAGYARGLRDSMPWIEQFLGG